MTVLVRAGYESTDTVPGNFRRAMLILISAYDSDREGGAIFQQAEASARRLCGWYRARNGSFILRSPAAAKTAQLGAGFATFAALTTFAPQMGTGDRTSVAASEVGTHAAIAGEVALGGAGAAVGAPIPNAGIYVRQASGALWRVADLDSQISKSAALQAATSASITEKPLVAGKKNASLDPFFRHFDIGASFGGKARWAVVTGSGYELSLVDNPVFDGRALRRNVAGTVNQSGYLTWLDDFGAKPGDTITLRALVVGNGAVAGLSYKSRKDGAVFGSNAFMLSDTGATTVTTSAVPQRMTATFVVPADATDVVIYPFSNTASPDFSIVAGWGYKGAADKGPAWPTFSDDDYQNASLADVSIRAARIDAVLEAALLYDSRSAVIPATSLGDGTSILSITGWASVLSPAAVTFNAITVRNIKQPSGATALASLGVVVRKAASGAVQNAAATVVAVGTAKAVAGAARTDIALRHPTTGALISLSNADLDAAEYAVMVYAMDATGTKVGLVAPGGILSNQVGRTYYVQAGNPVTSLWATSANVPLGFEHTFLTGLQEGSGPTQRFADQVIALGGGGGTTPTVTAPEVVLPPALYGMQGREANLYLDNVFLDDADRYNINIDTPGSLGQQQSERFTWTPAGAVTTGDLTLAVFDKLSAAELVTPTPTIALRSAAASAGNGVTKKVMVIGDSLVAAGTSTQTLLDIAAADPMKLTLYGSRGAGTNKHEGRGGYSIGNYTTSGPVYYLATVSGVVVAPAINATTYSHANGILRAQEVVLDGSGNGTILFSVDSGTAPPSSGTFTKANGAAGDATIAYTGAAAAPGNPFWIGGALNFGQYLTNQGYPALDWALVALGINGTSGQLTDAACVATVAADLIKLDTLIASIKASGATTKVGLVIPPPPAASQDGFGASYATGRARWREKRNILIFARLVIAKYKAQEANRIYLVPSNLNIDTVNNFQRGAAGPVNSRNTAMIKARQIDAVHPDTPGYQQIADAWWAFLKYYSAVT